MRGGNIMVADGKGWECLLLIVILSIVMGFFASLLSILTVIVKVIGVVVAFVLVVLPLFALKCESVVGKVFSIILHVAISVIFIYINFRFACSFTYTPDADSDLGNFLYNILYVVGAYIYSMLWLIVDGIYYKIASIYSDL